MNASFLPSRMRFSVDRYHKMIAAGVLTEFDHPLVLARREDFYRTLHPLAFPALQLSVRELF